MRSILWENIFQFDVILCPGGFNRLLQLWIVVTLACPPQGKDDITGEPLIQHDDDKPEALMARLRHYKELAKPVIDLYK